MIEPTTLVGVIAAVTCGMSSEIGATTISGLKRGQPSLMLALRSKASPSHLMVSPMESSGLHQISAPMNTAIASTGYLAIKKRRQVFQSVLEIKPSLPNQILI